MISNFITAKNISQVSDDFIVTIPWENIENSISMGAYAITEQPLHCISGLWQERFRSKSSQIWFTNYEVPSYGILTGIELRVNVLRSARIEDLVIQLTLNGELIGQNQAIMKSSQEAYYSNTEQVGDYHVYGGDNNLWGSEITENALSNPSFGVVISYQSNEFIPHTDLVYVNQVALRFHFV